MPNQEVEKFRQVLRTSLSDDTQKSKQAFEDAFVMFFEVLVDTRDLLKKRL